MTAGHSGLGGVARVLAAVIGIGLVAACTPSGSSREATGHRFGYAERVGIAERFYREVQDSSNATQGTFSRAEIKGLNHRLDKIGDRVQKALPKGMQLDLKPFANGYDGDAKYTECDSKLANRRTLIVRWGTTTKAGVGSFHVVTVKPQSPVPGDGDGVTLDAGYATRLDKVGKKQQVTVLPVPMTCTLVSMAAKDRDPRLSGYNKLMGFDQGHPDFGATMTVALGSRLRLLSQTQRLPGFPASATASPAAAAKVVHHWLRRLDASGLQPQATKVTVAAGEPARISVCLPSPPGSPTPQTIRVAVKGAALVGTIQAGVMARPFTATSQDRKTRFELADKSGGCRGRTGY